MDLWPPTPCQELLLSLRNSPLLHPAKDIYAMPRFLPSAGQFLFQESSSSACIILSVAEADPDADKLNIREFTVQIDESSLVLLGNRFHCMESLERYLRHSNPPELPRCEHAVRQGDYPGSRFGYAVNCALPPRRLATGLVKHKKATIPCRLISLRRSIRATHDDLEEMIKMGDKCGELLPLLDYHISSRASPIQSTLLRFQAPKGPSLLEFFQKHDQIGKEKKLTWIHQAASALSFLSSREFYHGVLTPTDCWLDPAMNIQVGGYWRLSWPEELAEAVNDELVWRSLAPECLLDLRHSPSSLLWNLGVFAWQMFTHCRAPPFNEFTSPLGLVRRIDSACLIHPGELTPEKAKKIHPDVRSCVIAQYQQLFEQLPPAPESIVSLVSRCIRPLPADRPCWSAVTAQLRSDAKIASIANLVERINIFHG